MMRVNFIKAEAPCAGFYALARYGTGATSITIEPGGDVELNLEPVKVR